MTRIPLLLLLTLASSGCVVAIKRAPAWQLAPTGFDSVSDDILAGLVQDGDRAWPNRSDPEQLKEAARSYKAALRERPSDTGVILKMARLAYYKGTLGGREAAKSFDESVGWCERALTEMNPTLGGLARAKRSPVEIFAAANKAEVETLALYGEALLDWSLAEGQKTLLAQAPLIDAAAKRVLVVDPRPGWGQADRALGRLYSELPKGRRSFFQANEHFKAALALAPSYLPGRLAYARDYAARVHDRAFQRQLLESIVHADLHALPDARPENEAAQREAERLLKQWLP